MKTSLRFGLICALLKKENKRKLMEDLIAKLNPGDIVMGEVTYVDDKFAKVE